MRTWSVSSIRQFHGCQLAWWFQRTGVAPEFKPLALVAGTAVHAAIEHHLLGLRDGAVPSEEEDVELLRAAYFSEEAGGTIRYGEKEHDEVLDRLSHLYLYWRKGFKLDADLVVNTSSGDRVVDFKCTAAKPSPDPLLDPLDLQKLAMTRGWEAKSRRTVTSWRWEHLVKTKSPNVVDVDLPVADEDRDADLGRLAAVVNPTLRLMDAVLAGKLDPVPTQAPMTLCGSCAFRGHCVLWGSPHKAHYAESSAMRSPPSLT